MAGFNTTGKAKTDDYVLGRGIAYFASLNAAGLPIMYRDLGNAPGFNMTVTTETLDHKSSRAGLKVVDKQIIVSQEVKVGFELDEVNFENLTEFFAGAEATFSNTAASAGVTPDATDGNVKVITQGRWYDLYSTTKGLAGVTTDSQASRIYDITVSTVKNVGGSTTYVAGTDYILDLVMGRIFIVAGGAMTGAASPGTPYLITITANGSADTTVDELKALTRTTVKGALKFIQANPANSDFQTEVQIHQISLKADGDFGLISDQVSTMKFTGVAERNEGADADSPYFTIRTHANAHS